MRFTKPASRSVRPQGETLTYNRQESLLSNEITQHPFQRSSSVLAASAQAQILPNYTLTNVAGNGTAGFAGDGAAAKDATLNFPLTMTRSSSGILYIADSFNARIRSIQSDGIIRTVVGYRHAGFLLAMAELRLRR